MDVIRIAGLRKTPQDKMPLDAPGHAFFHISITFKLVAFRPLDIRRSTVVDAIYLAIILALFLATLALVVGLDRMGGGS